MIPDPSLDDRLRDHGQEHLLKWWGELDAQQQQVLLGQIAAIDFDQLTPLIRDSLHGTLGQVGDLGKVGPIDVIRLPRTDGERIAQRHVAEVGAAALSAGEVAVVVVAGGSGTRLGFDGPKGTYPIGPVSSASLFQIHAEKVVALSRRYGKPIPFYVMTSPENHQATVDFFQQNGNFGLTRLRFFTQGTMPAVELETGKILLSEKRSLALSPDGHGGTLIALSKPGPQGAPSCLEEMRENGIRTLYYFQVDNPLAIIGDPVFLGHHHQAEADMSFKVIEKVAPEEKLGVVVSVDGHPTVIEYSDLPAELAERRDDEGNLELWAGSIAIHLIEREFVERLVANSDLPFHRAIKKVPYVDENGTLVKPERPNAVKFERFIFDALPLARRWALVETSRVKEFEPLKNATGSDSPESVRRRMSDLFADWLERAGAIVPREADGSSTYLLEISPLFAMNDSEVKARIEPGFVVDGPLYLNNSTNG